MSSFGHGSSRFVDTVAVDAVVEWMQLQASLVDCSALAHDVRACPAISCGNHTGVQGDRKRLAVAAGATKCEIRRKCARVTSSAEDIEVSKSSKDILSYWDGADGDGVANFCEFQTSKTSRGFLLDWNPATGSGFATFGDIEKVLVTWKDITRLDELCVGALLEGRLRQRRRDGVWQATCVRVLDVNAVLLGESV